MLDFLVRVFSSTVFNFVDKVIFKTIVDFLERVFFRTCFPHRLHHKSNRARSEKKTTVSSKSAICDDEALAFVSDMLERIGHFALQAIACIFVVESSVTFFAVSAVEADCGMAIAAGMYSFWILHMADVRRMVSSTWLALRGHGSPAKAMYHRYWTGPGLLIFFLIVVVWHAVIRPYFARFEQFVGSKSAETVTAGRAVSFSSGFRLFEMARAGTRDNVMAKAIDAPFFGEEERLSKSSSIRAIAAICRRYCSPLIEQARLQNQRDGRKFYVDRTQERIPRHSDKTYEYQTLDKIFPKEPHIRLLVIWRDRFSGEVHTKLEVTTLSDAGHFEAISYCWGKPKEGYSIILDGCVFPVWPSARYIVEELVPAKHSTYRKLWIDAICINQENEKELDQQKALMRDIYAKASRVIIFLSTSSKNYDDCDVARYQLQELARQIQTDGIYKSTRTEKILRRLGLAGTVSPGRSALDRLFGQKYWSRLWVVQEIAVANSLQIFYGDNEIPWEEIRFVVQHLPASAKNNPLTSSRNNIWSREYTVKGMWRARLIARIRDKYQTSEKFDFAEILCESGKFDATKKKDHVYAIQGLVRTAIPPHLQGFEDDRVAALYYAATRTFLQENDPLWFLSLAGTGFGERSVPHLPSWVPNWSKTHPLTTCRRRPPGTVANGRRYGRSWPRTFIHKENVYVLQVLAAPTAILSSTVKLPFSGPDAHRFDLNLPTTDPSQVRSLLREDYKAFQDFLHHAGFGPCLTPSDPLRALCGLLTGAAHDLCELTQTLTAMEELFQEQRARDEGSAFAVAFSPSRHPTQHAGQRRMLQSAASLEAEREAIRGFCRLASAAAARGGGRRLGVTAGGGFALVPAGAEEGDCIFDVKDAGLPLVLRRDGRDDFTMGREPGECFTLVGHCAVQNQGLVKGKRRRRTIYIA